MFRRPVVAAIVLALLLGACGGDAKPKPPGMSTVRVFQTGHSVRSGELGVAGLVRVLGTRPVENIQLSVNFLDKRTNFNTDTVTIPYCPASRDCWWGKSYSRGRLGKPPSTVDEVGVAVLKIGAYGGTSSVRELRLSKRGRSVRVDALRRRGVVHVIAFRRAVPRFGWSRDVNRTTSRIDAPGPLRGERARAFFYER